MSLEPKIISKEYDKIAGNLGLYPEFYTFVLKKFLEFNFPKNIQIADIGCGNGKLLKKLNDTGYTNLVGIDISKKNIQLAQAQVPNAQFYQRDIETQPLKALFHVIFMTEVIEHLQQPLLGLKTIKQALMPGGKMFLTFPNKFAFFPLFYLKPIIERINFSPGIKKRLQWLCLPYEMRSQQPVDHAYQPREIRNFLKQQNFTIIQEDGMRLFPMLHIPNWRWTNPFLNHVEFILRPVTPKRFYYRYMFICQG